MKACDFDVASAQITDQQQPDYVHPATKHIKLKIGEEKTLEAFTCEEHSNIILSDLHEKTWEDFIPEDKDGELKISWKVEVI